MKVRNDRRRALNIEQRTHGSSASVGHDLVETVHKVAALIGLKIKPRRCQRDSVDKLLDRADVESGDSAAVEPWSLTYIIVAGCALSKGGITE